MDEYSRFSGVAMAKGLLVVIAGSSGLCAVAWLLLKVELSKLLLPWLLYCGLGTLLVPFLYWSMRRQARTGDWRPFFVVFGAFCMAACPLLFYSGTILGFVRKTSLPGLCLTAIICIPLLFPAAYHLLKELRLLPPRRVRG
jgi:hypothetical protein